MYRAAIGVAVIVAGWFFYLDRESMKSDLATSTAAIKTLDRQYSELKDDVINRDFNNRNYFTLLNSTQKSLETRVSKLASTKERESTIAKKPGLVTNMAKKQNTEYEEKLACLTGNIQYCR